MLGNINNILRGIASGGGGGNGCPEIFAQELDRSFNTKSKILKLNRLKLSYNLVEILQQQNEARE